MINDITSDAEDGMKKAVDSFKRDLRVMDATAFALCRDNELAIAVFELATPGNIQRVVCGEPIGTIVKNNQETRFAN